jgi:hypothetical protein
VWRDESSRYACGVLEAPERHLPLLAWLPRAWTQRWVARWIAAGRGCDADLERA